MKPRTKIIAKQTSWVIGSDQVELAITRIGGYMGPVTFYRKSAKPVLPYYVSPWQFEAKKIDDTTYRPLRGDFFCAPFGPNDEPYRGEKHPGHGEPANAKWKLAGADKAGAVTRLTLSMKTKIRPGTITKKLMLVDCQNVVYSQHTLAGMSGPMPIAHHATLAMPEAAESVRVATSPIMFGQTNPGVYGDPAEGAYQSLAIDKKFKNPKRVPTLWADEKFTDCTSFPARRGFTDFLVMFNRQRPGQKTPAWTTATYTKDGFLWFSLKDPAVLNATAMWMANRGRHPEPWNGRNCCLGLEDICSYFCEGLAASAKPNQLTKKGIATAVKLSKSKPTVVNYIQGVIKVPRGFDRVATARFTPGAVTFRSESGKTASAKVCWEFLKTGELCY